MYRSMVPDNLRSHLVIGKLSGKVTIFVCLDSLQEMKKCGPENQILKFKKKNMWENCPCLYACHFKNP